MRLAQALRLEDVAAQLNLAPSSLSRMETGKTPVKAIYLPILLDLYRVHDETAREQLGNLARNGRSEAWHNAYHDLIPRTAVHYLELEAAAAHVRGFFVNALPGFVQTRSYAQAFLEATRPELDEAARRELAGLLLRRQRLLNWQGRLLDLVLDESVLLRSVGSPQITADQLEHLLTLTGTPPITVRVIRLATIQPVLSPSFTLLSLPGSANPDTVCLESISGQVDVSRRAATIGAAQKLFEALAQAALPPATSAKLIAKHAERVRDRHRVPH